MSDLFGNHIVGFPTRRLIYVFGKLGRSLVSCIGSGIGKLDGLMTKATN